MRRKILFVAATIFSCSLIAQNNGFNGLDVNMGNLYRISNAQTFSISPENLTGEKGKGGMIKEGTAARAARELGQGWKENPYINIDTNQTVTIAEIDGSGSIQHIWMTPTGKWRFLILRIYWDGEKEPSVEVPVGDFFGMGWGKYSPLNSLPVCVNPGSAFNCYWPMPFRKKAKITMQNIGDKPAVLYYSVDYTRTEVPEDAAYFHAQFRRVNPLPFKDVYTIEIGRAHV